MNINQANTNLKVRRLMGLKPPAPSYAEIIATSVSASSQWYHSLLPGIGITIVLASGGRALLDRLSLPMTTILPSQTPAIPAQQNQPKVAKVQGRSIYSANSANLKSEQSLTIKAQLAGKISQVFVKPGDRVKAGQKLFQLSVPKSSDNRLAPAIGNNTNQANSSDATTKLSAPETRKVSAQADVEFKQQEYQK